ncbi:MAG: ABC transporter permease subunit [Actinobacteria bacterium]|nr:ABC transporter permease subunit [Actinomycetota bacterium]
MSGSRFVRLGAGAFVEVFRNIPALIQIIFWAFAFPSLFGADVRRAVFFDNVLWDAVRTLTGIPIPYYAVAASVGLVLNTGAHLAEIFRAGAGSVPNQDVEAATMLGAGRWLVLSSIVIPGALRSSFPAITTRLIHNLKNTALVSLVAVPDLFHAMQGAISESFRATELLTLTALSYLVLTAGLARLLALVDVRLHRGRDIRGAV